MCSKLVSMVFAAVAFSLVAAGPARTEPLGVEVPAEPTWRTHVVTRQEAVAARKAKVPLLDHLFGDQASNVARFNRVEGRFVYAGRKLRVPELPTGAVYSPLPATYPAAAQYDEYILIVLDRQFLGVYSRGTLESSYPISSGRQGHQTPKGTFAVTAKSRHHKSSIYPEPNGGWPMPWALRFHENAYWMHAGDLVGRPDSHGCVRLTAADAASLFDRTAVGTPVRVVGSLTELR